MARGDSSPAPSSSSSGFSSDEDMADVSSAASSSAHVPVVRVEVVREAAEADVSMDQTTSPPAVEPEKAAASEPIDATMTPSDEEQIEPCCMEAVHPVVGADAPLSFDYELYTTATTHLAWHWPTTSVQEDEARQEAKLRAYHALRAKVYTRFQRAFPLTEDMYTQWVADVAASASSSDAAVTQQQKLFELAQQDYWSVPLALQHLRFLRDTEADWKTLEAAMQTAQRSVGLHFTQGHEVWALCRELTAELCDEDEVGSVADRALRKEQAVRGLFQRQMRIPLEESDMVLSEFRAWDAYNTLDGSRSNADPAFEQASQRQKKLFAPLMKKLRGLEARLTPTADTGANSVEQAWLQYLNFVKHRVAPLLSGDKSADDAGFDEGRALVVCLYERAVAAMCLSPTLWASYMEFLKHHPGDVAPSCTDRASQKLKVAHRAVRNVSFDSSAWTELLVEMEWCHHSETEIGEFVRSEVLTRTSPLIMDHLHFLGVLLTWCDVQRRAAAFAISRATEHYEKVKAGERLEKVFEECETFVAKTFPDFPEGVTKLKEYCAKCKWSLMPPTQRFMHRSVQKVESWKNAWDRVVATPRGDQAATWLQYAAVTERAYVYEVNQMRENVFEAGLRSVKDAPLTLAEAWLVFEREYGDLSSYLQARKRHAKLQAAALSGKPTTTVSSTAETHSSTDKEEKVSKKRKAPTGGSGRDPKGKSAQPTRESVAKRAKPETISGGSGDRTGPAAVPKPIPTTDPAEKKAVHESLTNEHTLFVCNVSKEASKEDVEALFKDIAGLKEVRLVVKTRGARVKSRGMAYVQFSDEKGVAEGVKLDGCLLHGSPLRVEVSKPPPAATTASAPGGKSKASLARDGSWKTNPVTLFVGGLNPSPQDKKQQQVTEERLQEALQQAIQNAGELVVVTRVSILKDRHGKLKNYGLVEVAEPPQVATCLANEAALQKVLGEQVALKPSRFSISEILSQQQQQQKQKQRQRKQSGDYTGGNAQSGRPSQTPNAPHASPSTRLSLSSKQTTSLMPRALRRKLAVKESENKAASSAAANSGAATTAVVTPKTNEDFRKLLLKK